MARCSFARLASEPSEPSSAYAEATYAIVAEFLSGRTPSRGRRSTGLRFTT